MSDRQAAQSRSGGHTSAGFRVSGTPLTTNFPRLAGKLIDYEAIKANAFHDHDLVVIPLKHPMLSWVDIEEAKRIGAKLYGKK
jgi:hypothetical protein